MSARDIPRRLFLGSAAGALAFRPSHTAQADTTFTNFRFAATGAPAARTMPDRLSDIVNVKDWGALGNGLTNDESSIQNAIDYKGSGQTFLVQARQVMAVSKLRAIRLLSLMCNVVEALLASTPHRLTMFLLLIVLAVGRLPIPQLTQTPVQFEARPVS